MLSWLFIALCVLDWWSAVILIRAALRLRYLALEERAGTATILAIVASGVAVLGVERISGVNFGQALNVVILVAVLGGLSVPSVLWLIAYFRGEFDA